MEIYKLFKEECCSISISGKSKDAVIEELADLACASKTGKELGRKKIISKIKDREAEGSTAFGGQIAIPHALIEGLEDFIVCIASSHKGVDFDALDKKKVKLFFLILGPAEKRNEHLQILAGISRTLTHEKVKKELMDAKSPLALMESFLRHLAAVKASGEPAKKMKLMIVVLFLEDLIYSVLEYFIQEGLDGATILDSSGMGEYISNVPIFASFMGFLNKSKTESKTILCLIPEDREKELVKGLEGITGDMDKKQGAMVMTLDVSFYKGTMKMMI